MMKAKMLAISLLLTLWATIAPAATTTTTATAATNAQQTNLTITPTVTLLSLKAKKITEQAYDQIYFLITELAPSKQPVLLRIPRSPLAWPLSVGQSIDNHILWQGSLKLGESTELIFNMVEQDLSVFDPDDVLGTAKLVLSNQNGHLRSHWTVAKSGSTSLQRITTKTGTFDRFIMKRDGGKYDITVSVKVATSEDQPAATATTKDSVNPKLTSKK